MSMSTSAWNQEEALLPAALPSHGPGDDPAGVLRAVDPVIARTPRKIPEPRPIATHGPARVLALCNQKGGVGKTTSTINLGAALAEYGRRILLVDFDPQGALSVGLGIQPVQLVSEVAREQTLLRILEPALPDYDYVLIDCQPSLGLLTVNALTAAHGVLIPLECEFFSLRGVALLIDTIEKVRERLNPNLTVDGILATMYDGRTVHGREVFARVVEAFGDTVYDTVITRTIRFPETTVAGEPITSWAPTSSGAKAYRNLAKEVLAR